MTLNILKEGLSYRLNRLRVCRSRAMADENEEKTDQLKSLAKEVAEETEEVKHLEEDIRSLKAEVVDAQDEQAMIEENHSTLIRAKDELRSDTFFNKYY